MNRWRSLFPFVAAIVVVGSVASAGQMGVTGYIYPDGFNVSPFGTCFHEVDAWIPPSPFYYDDEIEDGYLNTDMYIKAKAAGIQWAWASVGFNIEGHRGFAPHDIAVRTYKDIGIAPIGGVGPEGVQDLERYRQKITKAVTRYKGVIKAWRLGNEMDVNPLGGPYPTPGAYCDVLKIVHDCVKSVDPDQLVIIGPLALPDGTSHVWNNGDWYVEDGTLNVADEDLLRKCLHYIVNVKHENPKGYFDVVAFNRYPDTVDLNKIKAILGGMLDYISSAFKEYGVPEVPIWMTETSLVVGETKLERDRQATYLLETYRYLLRTGKVDKVSWYHFDTIWYEDPLGSGGLGQPYCLYGYDVDYDKKKDPQTTLYPAYYAYKKMTHFREEFDDDEFIEPAESEQDFYKRGWYIRGFRTWRIADGVFSGSCDAHPEMTFGDLCMPARQYKALQVRMRATQQDWAGQSSSRSRAAAKLYWDNESELPDTNGRFSFSDSKTVEFATSGGNAYHTYTIPLGKHPEWNGIISAVQFEPADRAQTRVDIDYIRFVTGPMRIVMDTSSCLLAGSSDAGSVVAGAADEEGNLVDDFDRRVTFRLSGHGMWDDGTTSEKIVRARNGRAAVLVRPSADAGILRIEASSDGLDNGVVEVAVIAIKNLRVQWGTQEAGAPHASLPCFTTDIHDVAWIYHDLSLEYSYSIDAGATWHGVSDGDDFNGAAIDAARWDVIGKGAESERPSSEATISAVEKDGVLRISGSTGPGPWGGKTLRSVRTYNVSPMNPLMVDVDRLSIAGSGTNRRSSLWLWRNDNEYIQVSQDIAGLNWEYNLSGSKYEDFGNPYPGRFKFASFGKGPGKPLLKCLDVGPHSMKIWYDGYLVRIYIDGVLCGEDHTYGWNTDIHIMLTAEAKQPGDTVDVVFDNLKITQAYRTVDTSGADFSLAGTLKPEVLPPDLCYGGGNKIRLVLNDRIELKKVLEKEFELGKEGVR